MSALRRIRSKARVSEYVIGFARLPASSNGHATSLAIVYRQVATTPHKFSERQTKIEAGCPTVFLHDTILVGWKIFRNRKSRVKFCRRNACRPPQEHGLSEALSSHRFRRSHDLNIPSTSPEKQFPRILYGVPPQLAEGIVLQDLGLKCICWIVIWNERGWNVRKPICYVVISRSGLSASEDEPLLRASQPCYRKTILHPIVPFL